MPSNESYLEYVLDLCKDLDNISYKKMMGEYLLYKDNILFGGIYDNRFLIKKTKYSSSLGLSEEIPYNNAKVMYLIDIEDSNKIKEIIEQLVLELK